MKPSSLIKDFILTSNYLEPYKVVKYDIGKVEGVTIYTGSYYKCHKFCIANQGPQNWSIEREILKERGNDNTSN